MLFTIIALEQDPIDFDLSLPAGVIDYGQEAIQLGALATEGRAEVLHEHRGPKEIVADIRLKGSFSGAFETPCARCVEPVKIDLGASFDLLFRPPNVDITGAEHAISTQETEIGYYENGGLALEDVLREQVLLSLPARTLCQPECKGLCPRCGQNLNELTCSCLDGTGNEGRATLADLSSKFKSVKR